MSEQPGQAQRTALRADIALAALILPQVWPLESFVAVNPLGGLEDLPFEEAAAIAGEALGARATLDERAFRVAQARGRVTDDDLQAALEQRVPALLCGSPVRLGGRTLAPGELLVLDLLEGLPCAPPVRRLLTAAERSAPAVAAIVDAQTAKWCGAFLGGSQAAWPMPHEGHFYAAWRRLAPRDRTLPGPARARLKGLPARADDAVLDALERLGVPVTGRRTALRSHLAALPGWSAHVRAAGDRGEGIDLLDLLALRLSYEAALLVHPPSEEPAEAAPEAPSPRERALALAQVLGGGGDLDAAAAVLAGLPVHERALVWLDAYEAHYRDRLLAQLSGRPARDGRPAAQLVCCIDVREEGLRRHLEALGAYETLGFAGFFGVPMRYRRLGSIVAGAQCPVLVEARAEVSEAAVAGAEATAARHLAGACALLAADDAFHAAKNDAAAAFALAEAAGWAAGPLAAAKTLLAGPYGALREGLHRRAAPEVPTRMDVEDGFTLDERAMFAEAALRTMGLTRSFARLVILCGHDSRSENNPYASALACGACGGHGGAPNARAAAALLADPAVRARLAARGIDVPQDTWFAAAVHDTTSDEVTLLDPHLLPETHREDAARVAADLAEAGRRLAAERLRTLPGAPRAADPDRSARHARSRGSDWAQVFPEWGLAGCAALIVGPRAITRGVDLERRCFLHTYDAEADPTGAALETILTAPLVVAQWIACQYYFSSVEPDVFGAGNKTVHNVLGGFGVLSGPDGDLRLGLPWQSVADGERLVHEPMRLLAVVQAPLERVDAIVSRNTVLRHLFDNSWVALAAREQPGDRWARRTPAGWRPWKERRSLHDEP